MGIVKFSKKLKGSQKKEQFVAPDGPHPYIGPDEEIVRKIAEKNTAEVLNKLFHDAKTMERFRHWDKNNG